MFVFAFTYWHRSCQPHTPFTLLGIDYWYWYCRLQLPSMCNREEEFRVQFVYWEMSEHTCIGITSAMAKVRNESLFYSVEGSRGSCRNKFDHDDSFGGRKKGEWDDQRAAGVKFLVHLDGIFTASTGKWGGFLRWWQLDGCTPSLIQSILLWLVIRNNWQLNL